MSASSIPFWEQFQGSDCSPISNQSEPLPLFDVGQEGLSERPSVTWEKSEIETAEDEPTIRPQRPQPGFIASKPSETVSLRFGMASFESVDTADSDDPSSDPKPNS